MRITITLITGSALLLAACGQAPEPETNVTTQAPPEAVEQAPAPSRFDIYASVQLKPDLSELSDHQREMISLLIDAAKITEDIFWQQVWGATACWPALKIPKHDDLPKSTMDPGTAWPMTSLSWSSTARARLALAFTPRT